MKKTLEFLENVEGILKKCWNNFQKFKKKKDEFMKFFFIIFKDS